MSIQFLLMCPPYVALFVNAFHYRFDSSVFFFHGATMPRVRSHTISRRPSSDDYPSYFEQIRRWRLHENLRIYFWISMTWADLAGRRHQPLQFFHTDMQTQLEVYNAAQRLLRTEPRTIQSVQTNIHSMQLDVNLICKCKRTDCFAISQILCYLGASLILSLIVHDH